MPYYVDAGVPFEWTLRELAEQDPRPMPAPMTNWLFSMTGVPCGGFAGSPQSGRWLPLTVEQTNPVAVTLSRPHAWEMLKGYLRYSGWNHFYGPEESFYALAPTPVTTPVITAAPRPGVVDYCGQSMLLQAGVDVPAITIAFEAHCQDGSSGDLAVISLIKSTRQVHVDQGVVQLTTGNEFVLDNTRDAQTYLYGDSTVAAGQTFLFNDNPKVKIEPEDRRIVVDEQFRTTLVFKSDKSLHACWVPLQTVEWGWKADARLTNTGWVVDIGKNHHDPAYSPEPRALQWNGYIYDYKYAALLSRARPFDG